MRLVIKNMVCPRCIASVEHILLESKIPSKYVRLGEVELMEELDSDALVKFSAKLKQAGFELLDDRRRQLIEHVKKLLLQKVQSGNLEDHFSISKYLGQKIFKDYSSVSRLFSEVEGITIEQYFILQKIEKIKEWLMYDELSLSQIANNLGYSSSQHLSSQFKKFTGMTPSRFKELGATHRKPIDQVTH